MNLQDQVLYRCVHGACARPLPHKVAYCPYCGSAQREGAARPVPAPVPAPVPVARREEVIYQAPPDDIVAVPVPAPAPVIAKAVPQVAPRPAGPAAPPRPKPIRLRWWLISLGLLALIWYNAKPDSRRIDERITSAIALSADCKFTEAQAELIALREDKATPAQLQRLQAALNGAVPVCEKKRLRARSWTDTSKAVDAALDDGDTAKAQMRLAQFTKRYGEDDAARALKARIAEQRANEAPPPKPVPQIPAEQKGQSARNLISEAEREIERGNYKAAIDKLDTCIAMIEGSRECAAYKVHAEKLLRAR